MQSQVQQINKEVKVTEAIILDGQSLSNEIDLTGSNGGALDVIILFMPAVWNGTQLTYQASDVKGGTYRDLYDDSGTQVTSTVAASRAISEIAEIRTVRFLRIRSGTAGTPVNQQDDRTIKIVATA